MDENKDEFLASNFVSHHFELSLQHLLVECTWSPPSLLLVLYTLDLGFHLRELSHNVWKLYSVCFNDRTVDVLFSIRNFGS